MVFNCDIIGIAAQTKDSKNPIAYLDNLIMVGNLIVINYTNKGDLVEVNVVGEDILIKEDSLIEEDNLDDTILISEDNLIDLDSLIDLGNLIS